MTLMTRKNFKKELDLESISLDLPIKGFSLLSYIENINYTVTQLQAYPENYVVGYFTMRSIGSKEILHQILPEIFAKKLKNEDSHFDYITLGELLKKQNEVNNGKYNVNNKGLIIGLNPAHSH